MPKLVPEWLAVPLQHPGHDLDTLLGANPQEPQRSEGLEWLAPLQAAGARLTTAKHALEKTEGIRDALRRCDLYADLKGALRSLKAQAPTNAWLKMYEMIGQLDLCPATGTVRVFCNAELPGAFVAAWHHYAETRSQATLEWAACSLWSDTWDDGVLGDQYGLAAGTPDRWLMSSDMRGDLTRVRDVARLVDCVRRRIGPVDVYCSDAGIDVGQASDQQEELTAPVHLGQVVTGLAVLRPGGTMVVKTFTFTKPWSAALLGVCRAAFDDVSLVKPVTSRAANSEVYLVSRGFLGVSDAAMRQLLAGIKRFDFGRPLLSIGALGAMADSLVEAAERIYGQQVEYLEEVVAVADGGEHDVAGAGRAARAAWRAANPILPLERPLPTKLTKRKR